MERTNVYLLLYKRWIWGKQVVTNIFTLIFCSPLMEEYTALSKLWFYVWKHNLSACFQVLFRNLKDKDHITMKLPIIDYASMVKLRKETNAVLPAKNIKPICIRPTRPIDYLFQRKHHCFFHAGIPPLTHLCIDALAACSTPKYYEQVWYN
jgi:hypothetical protein